MSNEWITDEIEALKKIYREEDCGRSIESFIISVIKLLNGMNQIMNGDFHRYEQQILGRPIELFCRHFKEQMMIALQCGDIRERDAVVTDIEEAVMQVSQVYKNVVDSTSNTDRRMFMSLSVDTSLYELSPKLCSLYAAMLDKVVRIYSKIEDEPGEYAFLIHPTLEDNIKAKALFKKRTVPGKVVVVYIPVNMLDRIDVVSAIVFHEAFHSVSRWPRRRDLRCEALLKSALRAIRDRLFEDAGFKEDKLMDGLLEEMEEEFLRECRGWDEGARQLYGDEVAEKIGTHLNTKLIHMQNYLIHGQFELNYMRENGDGFAKRVEEYKTGCMKNKYFQEQVRKIMAENLVDRQLDADMWVLREAYADLACIMTVRLEPEIYDKAFECSVQFDSYDFDDQDRDRRLYLVYDTVATCMSNLKDEGDQLFAERWSAHWSGHWENKMGKLGDIEKLGKLEDSGKLRRKHRENSALQYPVKYAMISGIQADFFLYLRACFAQLRKIEEVIGTKELREHMSGILPKKRKAFFVLLGGNIRTDNLIMEGDL